MTSYNLPLPISTNALFFNKPRGGRAKTERYKDWLHQAGIMLIAQRARPVMGQVELHIVINDASRCDPDNTLKCVFDAIVSRGLIEDDSPKFIRRFTFERSKDIDGIRITILPAKGKQENGVRESHSVDLVQSGERGDAETPCD